MTAPRDRRTWFRTTRRALIRCAFAAGVVLAPTAGFAQDPDTHAIVERAAEKAASKAVESAVEKATGTVAEQTAVKAAEIAAEEATAKQEITAQRPEESKGPTEVFFIVLLIDVDSIDDANQSFMANVFVRLRWNDARLANPGGASRQVHLEEVWNPQLILTNRQGLVSRSLPEVVQVDPDGTVTYRQRYSGMLSQPLQLADFPLDRHSFTIHFVSAAYDPDELTFTPDVPKQDPTRIGGAMADKLSLPDWKVLGYEALSLPYRPVAEVRAAGFAFRFEAERYVEYYVWQVLVPLSVVVMMSWTSFWVRRGNDGVRIGIATSSILTLIAQRFILASLVPRLPYMTRLDYFTAGSTLLVFLALIAVIATSYLGSTNRLVAAKLVDLFARATFPAAFVALLGWFVYS